MENEIKDDFIKLLRSKNYSANNDIEIIKWLVGYVVNYELGNTKKGLTLSGVPGCGKSFFFEIFQEFSNLEAINSTMFLREAMESPDRIYEMGVFEGDLIIDDLGAEVRMMRYGMETEIFTEILTMRYELWRQEQTLTLITTNLTALEIEKRYGVRVAHRIFEMTNFLTHKGGNLRKFGLERFNEL